VLGIGAAGLLQMVVLGAVGLGVGTATGVVTLSGTAVSVFLGSLGWFLLGFLFFAVLYAAAGSLVSRQEELNAVTTPMTLLILLPFFVAIYSAQSPGGGLARTLAWIPPFSPMLMPFQQASGEAGVGITVLAVGLMLAATAVFTWLGGRVYAGAVLRSGSRVTLREALSGT
jgi:ABC-2 type transport system permease protein